MPRSTGPGHADDARRLADGGLGPVPMLTLWRRIWALLSSKIADYGTRSLVRWQPNMIKAIGKTSRDKRLPMTWDFAEGNPFWQQRATSGSASRRDRASARMLTPLTFAGRYCATDAQKNNFPSTVFSTDPPYYDNIGYADLSDFFYVWLRRTLAANSYPTYFRRVVTPKNEELVATPYRHGGKEQAEAFFLEGMKKALCRNCEVRSARRVQRRSIMPSSSPSCRKTGLRLLVGRVFFKPLSTAGSLSTALGQYGPNSASSFNRAEHERPRLLHRPRLPSPRRHRLDHHPRRFPARSAPRNAGGAR